MTTTSLELHRRYWLALLSALAAACGQLDRNTTADQRH